jgi:hypothetical protein
VQQLIHQQLHQQAACSLLSTVKYSLHHLLQNIFKVITKRRRVHKCIARNEDCVKGIHEDGVVDRRLRIFNDDQAKDVGYSHLHCLIRGSVGLFKFAAEHSFHASLEWYLKCFERSSR